MSVFDISLSRRRFSQVVSGIAGLGVAGPGLAGRYARAAGLSALSSVTLRVASFRGMESCLLPALGLDDFPYRVVFSEFSSGNLIAQAISADAVDVGGWSEIPLVFIAAAQARVAVVATTDGPTTDQALMVPAGSSARSVGDLRGKRVGYIRSTTSHYFLIRMLDQAGMSFSDIVPVALGPSQGLTAMQAGSLDAWATYGYVIQRLQAEGSARILESAADILSGHYFIGANPLHLEDDLFRRAVADYIHRVGRAYEILSADKQRWAKIVSPVITVPEPEVLSYLQNQNRPYHPRAWTGSDIEGVEKVARVFVRERLIPGDTDVRKVFSDALSPLLRT
ncbi:ABC transporter substrate-binding protein [Acetobacter musti]|uniref:ABC transporter substrate-binding protein n=1 Tax=Acetobacter musti TaxID=864732 RepID=UPI0030D00289